VKDVRAIDAALDVENGPCAGRRAEFLRLQAEFQADLSPMRQRLAKMMTSWESGLFCGGSRLTLLQDNLALELWFKNPKSHERRIHGHAHAGVRIVQEGPTLLLTLDAHPSHPEPFTEAELAPYMDATPPRCQLDAMRRRGIMRRARSMKGRRGLLAALEQRFRETS